MAKTFTDLTRHGLNGPTMGTRWSALLYAPHYVDPTLLSAAMAAGVAEVDAQMSTWRPDSDLMRVNAAPSDIWIDVPKRLMVVLEAALAIGRASGGAFDIGVGDAVAAWGFGPAEASPKSVRAALAAPRRPAHELLELDPVQRRLRKHAALTLDLSGIAKGYGVDRLAEIAVELGVVDALLAIDGELRVLGRQPDGSAWPVAIERPDTQSRALHAILDLCDAAVATSGDYRHWVEVGGRRLSHTMDPPRGGPLAAPPASVTVIAATCMAADAWATALMVLGSQEGEKMAQAHQLDALFIDRAGEDFRETPVGAVFRQGGVGQGRDHAGHGCAAWLPPS